MMVYHWGVGVFWGGEFCEFRLVIEFTSMIGAREFFMRGIFI